MKNTGFDCTPSVIAFLRYRVKGYKGVATKLERAWVDDKVRLLRVEDTDYSLADLKGDCFSPRVNSDIPAERLAAEEREFEERVSRLGVHGLLGTYKSPPGEFGDWLLADSCYGFVGEDYLGSGYEVDIALSALEKAGAQ